MDVQDVVYLLSQKFHDDLDEIKKALLGADKNFRDIIDRGYMTDPDGFRDQVLS